MARFRKKTDEVEARQVPLADFVWEVGAEEYADLLRDISGWCAGMTVFTRGQELDGGIYIESNGSTLCAKPGDWIVKTSHDGWKVYTDVMFNTIFEPVKEGV